MLAIFLSMSTWFNTISEPLYTDEDGKYQRIWEPVKDPENPIFLQIDKEVKMISEPVKDAIKFWDTLNLNESYAYEYA